MRRRYLLKYISLSTVGAAFSFSYPSLQAAIAKENNPEQHSQWGYDSEHGPESWSKLSPDYRVCEMGQQQSPINLEKALHTDDLGGLELDYHLSALRIVDNGHTIVLHTDQGNHIMLDNQNYDLSELHFHHPSEHIASGKSYPMEAHFVHRNSEGKLTVLGVFFQQGKENQVLKQIWSALPEKTEPEHIIPGVHVNLAQLLPSEKRAYRYFGSLTTPPCSQGVNWIVFEEPIEASQEQLDMFARIYPNNARPVQPRNNRFVIEF